MLFFARFVVWLGDMLPPGKLRGRLFQRFDYLGCKQKVVAWHLAELKKLDLLFALSQEALRISAAYDQAEAAGIGPSDPRYPRLFDSGICWEIEARSSAEVLDRYKKTGAERMKRFDEALKIYPQERVDAVTQATTDALKQKETSQSRSAIPGNGFMGEID